MLNLSDSRNFSRTLSVVGLLAGPLLILLGSMIDPAWSDDPAVYLQEVQEGSGAYMTAGLFATLGSFFLVAGLLGVVKLMRGPGVTLGQFGAGLMTLGAILFSATAITNGFDVVLSDLPDRAAGAAAFERLEAIPATAFVFFVAFFGGLILGSILLAAALIRRRLVPMWAPILLVVSNFLFFAGDGQIFSVLSNLLFLAALAPLAMKIYRISDEAWGSWLPAAALPEAPVPPAPLVPPPPAATPPPSAPPPTV